MSNTANFNNTTYGLRPLSFYIELAMEHISSAAAGTSAQPDASSPHSQPYSQPRGDAQGVAGLQNADNADGNATFI